jgi:hypothetical protein
VCRPDLTGAIVVGDFDPWRLTASCGDGSSHPRGRRRPRPTFTVPIIGTTFAIATDPENTATRVEVHHLLPERDLSTVEGYRLKILDRLFTGMVSARFAEAARQPDVPFVAAGATRGPYLVTRGREDAAFVANVRDNRVEAALGALLDEARRVARDRFGADELARQKRTLIRVIERAVADETTRDSASRAAKYIRNFTVGETLPTAALRLGCGSASCRRSPRPMSARWRTTGLRTTAASCSSPRQTSAACRRAEIDEAHLAAAVAAAARASRPATTTVGRRRARCSTVRCARDDRLDGDSSRAGSHRMDAVERRQGRREAERARG